MRGKPVVGMALLIGASLFVHRAQISGASAEDLGSGLVSRVETLKTRTDFDSTTIAEQAKQIAELQKALKVAVSEINANKASIAANSEHINKLSRRMGSPVKHEAGQWVHIGGGGIKEYVCPDGYVITGIRQEYHGGAWRNWIEKVHITRIVPAS